MRALILLFTLFSQITFAVPIAKTPDPTNKPVKKCQMQTVREENFLSVCPKGWVMTEARTIQGSDFLRVVCAEMEITCD